MDALPSKPLKTRDRILETARMLFNEQGVDAVSSRQIAAALEISHGNLCYHFARKEDIITALYRRLAKKMNETIDNRLPSGDGAEPAFYEIFETLWLSAQALWEYKFLMLDFVSVMRQSPETREHYRALAAKRKAQFARAQEYCVRQGWMRKEIAQLYGERLTEAMLIIGDFWIASAEILYEGDDNQKVEYYSSVFLSVIAPTLTPKGVSALQTLRKS